MSKKDSASLETPRTQKNRTRKARATLPETFTSDAYIVAGSGHTLEAGKEYEVRHSRKGTFSMRLLHAEGEWIEGIITAGKAKNLARMTPDCIAGDAITIRDIHSYFIPLEAGQGVEPVASTQCTDDGSKKKE